MTEQTGESKYLSIPNIFFFFFFSFFFSDQWLCVITILILGKCVVGMGRRRRRTFRKGGRGGRQRGGGRRRDRKEQLPLLKPSGAMNVVVEQDVASAWCLTRAVRAARRRCFEVSQTPLHRFKCTRSRLTARASPDGAPEPAKAEGAGSRAA